LESIEDEVNNDQIDNEQECDEAFSSQATENPIWGPHPLKIDQDEVMLSCSQKEVVENESEMMVDELSKTVETLDKELEEKEGTIKQVIEDDSVLESLNSSLLIINKTSVNKLVFNPQSNNETVAIAAIDLLKKFKEAFDILVEKYSQVKNSSSDSKNAAKADV
jgi:hypothetical protein